jgi:signal transduction histidine kinase
MKTLSTVFDSYDELNYFIEDNNIAKEQNVLIQIFSGYIDKCFLELLIEFLGNEIPNAKIIGSTTDGEIIEDSILEQSIILSFSIFNKTSLETYCVDLDGDDFLTGAKIAQMSVKEDTKVVIIFSDGLNTNGSHFLDGFSSITNKVLVAGGLAGDNSNFINTYVFNEKRVLQNGVVAVSLNSKDLVANSVYGFGWKPVGKKFVVTKSKDNIVYEIDNRPVIELFSKYLGEDISSHLPKIGVEIPFVLEKDGHLIARAVIGKHKDKSLIFAGDLPEGSEVRFAIGDSISLIEDSSKYLERLNQKPSSAIFAYSCMARKRVLHQEAMDEIVMLSQRSNVSGFFTYGEFFSFLNSDGSYKYELFNETLTMLALDENDFESLYLHKTNVEVPKKIYHNHCTALKKALTNFVNVTTTELEILNETLENKIAKEVEENLKTQKIVQQQSKQAQMGEMLSMIAHQWRQPLNAISTSVINLSLSYQLGTMNESSIETTSEFIQNQVQKMSKIIDGFIEFAKPEAQKKVFYSNEIIDGAIEIMQAQLSNRAIKVHITNSATEICGYKTLLEQVIINLVANARDAFEENDIYDRQIHIISKRKNSYFIIEVTDNAGGIPKEAQERIFNPYFTTKGAQGTGLGLYMSRDIMKKEFDGDLSFEVTEIGTKFTITIGPKVLNLEECCKD